MKQKNCRICNDPLQKILDLGRQPLGNGFLSKDKFKDEYFFQMDVGFSEKSKMFQLLEQPEPEKMFHEEYAFFSSTSKYMEKHFKEFADLVLGSKFLSQEKPFVVELGCNDGIMLKNFAQRNINHLGIEPSRNVAAIANQNGVKTISEFFNEEVAKKIVDQHGQADAFFAANVMCHIPDIKSVVKGIATLLKPTGVVMFEDPYLGDVVEKTSYDQIYDEHVFLFSGLSIQYLFNLYGLELIDLLPQKTHGGSMRYVLAHKGAYPVSETVHTIIEKETRQGLDKLETFIKFRENVEKSKSDLVSLLKEIKSQGKRVVGYAATSKSTTIFNYCGIGPDLIDFISDITPIKQGKFSPGVHIPVKAYSEFKSVYPDYAFLLAWNHSEEIMANEQEFMKSGGKWITHVPFVRVIK
ncbi:MULTISPECIES: class I SAM-dependent methyltransferase [Leptospira]|uniref:class I SAM-dependent methyltransferase n=1 Tax=Leptospira TaxID=171 RepID=UPI000297D30E|nr:MULTISPECIES: class I SAM-dependent methyltransferase [Leptospira]EKQ99252.1 C-methyltransferase C-terminal domain protein [Leptospira borgpetersenii serovar Castellonis str. 200801910]EMK08845.1 C-methyltransferase C-terminal domain protein [Leptospira sp. serovar Kenya str. Sh9]KGE24542.1 SAM-dependent methyltransferase [Leptospira borgpetersenii serovar Ballum]MBE8159739.1 class I SAM-dependent methyltransferase [Leptospira borgpetersenii serovar Ballum]MBE8164239.1 class I SAM-dependent